MTDQQTRRKEIETMHYHRDEFITRFWNITSDEQMVSQYDWLVANAILLQEIYEFIKSLATQESDE